MKKYREIEKERKRESEKERKSERRQERKKDHLMHQNVYSDFAGKIVARVVLHWYIQ